MTNQRVVAAPVRKKPKLTKQPQKDPKKALINAGGSDGMTALHMAAERGHEEVVRLLLSDSNINVEATTHASKNKLTPLIMACRMGFRNIADILIDEGHAIVEKGDKLKRTALTHAVLNGQNHIVAMLLRRGASPCTQDSSGNTPTHYAAAYGWFECLEMLAKADSSCLAIDNDWHLSPLAVAYLKGHIGIVDWLVGGPYSDKVTVNCCDQAGVSLISCVINCYKFISDERIVKQLEYLTSKGADCSLTDTRGNNALHYFASINAKFKIDEAQLYEGMEVRDNATRLTKDDYRRCIDLILHAGDDAFHVAVKTCNLYLAECLLNRMIDEGLDEESLSEKAVLASNASKTGNILHLILELPFKVLKEMKLWTHNVCPAEDQYNVVPLLQKIIALNSSRVIEWLQEEDAKGRTPVVLFCQQYVAATITNFHKYNEQAKEKCQEAFEEFMHRMCDVLEMLAVFDGTVLLQTFDVNGSNKKESSESNADDNEGEEESDGGCNLDGLFGNAERQDEPSQENENGSEGDGDVARLETSDSQLAESIEPEAKASHMNVISYGLLGNQEIHRTVSTFQVRNREYQLKNELLITMVEVAKKTGILDKLLAQRDADECTPFLYAIMHENLEMCLYLMQQRVAAIDSDTISRYYSVKKKRC
ncbi:unnamed protein product [Anisakis simplex]|uniref:Uncharacterized protein n=1 Tax=Anisakis simplex TaxID=6269 RepID=A0A3P6RMT2_ANISI|nr:unnamed protein product [Anisakis simplex]